jgi:hypothetical protein
MKWKVFFYAALAAGSAMAAPETEPVQQVQVNGMIDADEVSYRRLLRGLDAFEKYHALAPLARLHYRLYPVGSEPERPLAAQLRSEQGSTPLELDPDHSFALPRDEAAATANAVVRLNRKAGHQIWRIDVRSPGLAPNQRRLGDLRLECQVNREADLLHGAKTPAYLALNATMDLCTARIGGWLDVAPKPLFGVTMSYGERHKQLFSDQLYLNAIPAVFRSFYDTELADRTYWVHISDASWPDDTVLEFDYMTDDPAKEQP